MMHSQVPLAGQQEIELFQSLLDKYRASWQALPDKPEESPESNLCALWFAAAGTPKAVEFCARPELPSLTGTTVSHLEEMVEKNLSGVPLAHLTGRQCFMGLEMLAGPEALIPRKETEILGYAALEKLGEMVKENGFARVIDVCTGSGNLALALAYHQQNCRVYAADISQEAIDLAVRNAQYLGLSQRVEIRTGDLLEPYNNEEFIGKVDMITCNPPYISSAKMKQMTAEIIEHEPELAFDGGPFGVSIILRLISGAPRMLKPNSWLCFEVGLGQGEMVKTRIEKNGSYQESKTYSDNEGNIRAILAKTMSRSS